MMDEKIGGKRKPMLARKPAVVIAIGQAMDKAKNGGVPRETPEGLMCPKCGHELKDTPENREYAKMREQEMASEESDDEYEDED